MKKKKASPKSKKGLKILAGLFGGGAGKVVKEKKKRKKKIKKY